MVRFFNGTPNIVTNRIANPSFDVSAAGYTPLGGGNLHTGGSTGKYSLRVMWASGVTGPRAGVELASSARVATSPGTHWRASVDIGLGGSMVAARNVYMYLQWYNGTTFSSEQRSMQYVRPTSGANLTCTTAATAGSGTAVSLAVAMETADGPVPSGAVLYVDRVMLADGYPGGDYFDGNTPNTEWTTHAWTGTPGLSTSTRTTYAPTPADISEPLICYERTVTAEPRAVEHSPLSAPYPTVTYLGPGQETGHLTCRYGDGAEIDKLRAIAAAGPVCFQTDDGTIVPIRIRKIDVTDDYDYPSPRYTVGVDYLRIGA